MKNKKQGIVFALIVSFATASAPALADVTVMSEFSSLVAPLLMPNKWKVGDVAEYNVKMGAFGNIGKMIKSITKDEGAAIWMKQDVDMMGQKQVVEALINKADGKTLKLIVNGKEQAPDNEQPTIISQDYTDVTVPAGTFKGVIHVVAKTKQVSKFEVWESVSDIVMDGAAKTIMTSQMGDIEMEMTKQTAGK